MTARCGELDAEDLPEERIRTRGRRFLWHRQRWPQLDQIEHGISALARENAGGGERTSGAEEAGQFRPQLCRGPEIELVFHHAHDPFAERFEEEEVIVDANASVATPLSVHCDPASARPCRPAADARPGGCARECLRVVAERGR